MLLPNKKIKSVFFGTPDFSISSFESTYKNTHCLAVVTQPDRPKGRGQKLTPSPVKEAAQKLNIPVFTPETLKRESPELDSLLVLLNKEAVDIFVVTAYGNILPKDFLKIPKWGSINVHASLLPQWRGAAPIQRSIEAGDLETGLSLQKMIYKLDAGDVLLEKKVSLTGRETAGELWENLSKLSGPLMDEFYSSYLNIKAKPQNEALVTYAKMIEKEEALWTEQWSAHSLDRKVRAFSMWPQVKALFVSPQESIEIKILSGEPTVGAQSIRSGELALVGKDILLGCPVRPGEKSSIFRLLWVQAQGKGPMEAYAFFQNFFHKNSSGQGPLKLTKSKS